MRPLSHPSRRGVVVAAGTVAVGLGLAGCEWPPSDYAADSADDPQSSPGVPDDPDQLSLERVSSQIRAALDLVTVTMTTHPSLKGLSAIAGCHTAHLKTLGNSSVEGAPDETNGSEITVQPTPTASDSPTSTPQTLPQDLDHLISTEHQLVALLVREAGAAESGTLARLCAVMAAGLSPYVKALRHETPGRSDGGNP